MLAKKHLKVHAAVLLFFAQRGQDATLGLKGLNPFFILGIINENCEFDKNIESHLRNLSRYIHPDKFQQEDKEKLLSKANKVFQEVNNYKGQSVDQLKILIILKDSEKLEKIIQKFKEKYNIKGNNEKLDQIFAEAKKDPLFCSKLVSGIKTIKILLIVFFPLVVALLTAAIVVGAILLAFYQIFIKPFINLINKYSSTRNGIDQEQDADEEQSLCSILCSPILQVFLWAILLPIIVALSPVIAIFFAVCAIFVCHVVCDMFQPLVATCNQQYICEEEVKQVQELVKTKDWRDFREEHFPDITDDQEKEYSQALKALSDLFKGKSPSSEVNSVSEVKQGVQSNQAESPLAIGV